MVVKVDERLVAPVLPPGLRLSQSMLGVIVVYDVASGPVFAPHGRAFAGVAVQGHRLPDAGEPLCIIADVASGNAVEAIRQFYSRGCLVGEPHVQLTNGTLTASVSSSNVSWLEASGTLTSTSEYDATGKDLYLSLGQDGGLIRHFVSYAGQTSPISDWRLTIGPDAPPAFQPFRSAEVVHSIHTAGMRATWGEPHPVDGGAAAPPEPTAPAPTLVNLLVSIGLTPAEARIAARIGEGLSAREAARQLGISENTAKSALKVVYGKLGIHKQSELGAFLVRLGR